MVAGIIYVRFQKHYDMTLDLFLQCLGMGLLGMLWHTLQGAQKQRKRAKAANTPFAFGAFLKDQALALASTIVALIIIIFLFDELADFKPVVWKAVKFFMTLVGFCGNSLLSAALGGAEKKLLKVIDKKTDIADGK